MPHSGTNSCSQTDCLVHHSVRNIDQVMLFQILSGLYLISHIHSRFNISSAASTVNQMFCPHPGLPPLSPPQLPAPILFLGFSTSLLSPFQRSKKRHVSKVGCLDQGRSSGQTLHLLSCRIPASPWSHLKTFPKWQQTCPGKTKQCLMS